MRLYLNKKLAEREIQLEESMLAKRKDILNKRAGHLHHLLSTKVIPGIVATRAHSLEKATYPFDSKSNTAEIDITESLLCDNPTLTKWLQDHIQKNPSEITVRPPHTPLSMNPDDLKKLAQGPFMVYI